MQSQHEYTINSTDDIRKALEEAERAGYELTSDNSAFHIRGTAGEPISVDASLAGLYVVAHGPAPVYVFGKEVMLIADGSAVVYAPKEVTVDTYDSATVLPYGNPLTAAKSALSNR